MALDLTGGRWSEGSIERIILLKVLLAHTPQMRRDYYGERSLNGLRAVAEVKLHEGDDALDAAALIEAARDVDIIVADRMTPGPGEIFRRLPELRALVRCAIDIRNIDVAAASAAGVLVTHAEPGLRAVRRRARARLHGRPLARRFARDRRTITRAARPRS